MPGTVTWVILGNLGNTCDRFLPTGYKSSLSKSEMIHQAALIKGIEGIELVGSWDITESNVSEMKKLLADEGLGCVSIIPDLFSQKRWGLGSFSAKSAAIRQQALEETRSVCRIAREMTCPLINLWLGEIRALIAKGDATASTRWMRQLLMGTSHAAA